MSEAYVDYLASDHWRQLRRVKLEQRGYVCERCGYRGKRELGDPGLGLHVHHLTYERRGSERLDDLQVLCGWCHGTEHDLNSRATREQWEASVVDRALRMLHYDDEIDDEVDAWDVLATAAGF